MVEYREQSMKTIENWIKKRVKFGFRKLSCSSYEGFRYKKYSEKLSKMIMIDIRMPKEGTVIFEAYPGIHVNERAFSPMISVYCQRIKNEFGLIYADKERGNIGYRAESCILENPITERTLALFEKEAFKLLEIHYENLLNLSFGRLLSLTSPNYPCRQNKARNRKKYNLDRILDYLINRSNHNTIMENIDDASELSCHIMTIEHCYRLTYEITPHGFLNITAICGENDFIVPESYMYSTAEYLNRLNSSNSYAALNVGSEKEGYYCRISTSLLDGDIGDQTVMFMEDVLISILGSNVQNIEKFGSGVICESFKYQNDMMSIFDTGFDNSDTNIYEEEYFFERFGRMMAEPLFEHSIGDDQRQNNSECQQSEIDE